MRTFIIIACFAAASCAEEPPDGAVVDVLAGPRACDCGPVAVVTPEVIDFQRVEIGAYAEAAFTVTNHGNEPLIIDQVAFQGPAEFSFAQVPAPRTEPSAPFIAWAPPLTIAPGGHVVMAARYAPTAGLGVTGRLTLHTNEPAGRMRPTVLVTGEGVDECAVASDSSLSFGPTQIGEARMRSVDLVGCAVGGIRIVSIELTEDSHPDFEVDLGPLGLDEDHVLTDKTPLSLAPGQRARFFVIHTPSEPGLVAAGTVRVLTTSLSEPVEVAVFGSGTM